MNKTLLAMMAAALLAGCATQAPAPVSTLSDTMMIIRQAAAAAPAGIPGHFRLVIRAAGRRDGKVYLNTQPDYRDPRNVTIAMPQAVAQQAFGTTEPQQLQQLLSGKTLAVSGVAFRTTIVFNCDDKALGQPTKYYYQTHIRVSTAQQLTALGH